MWEIIPRGKEWREEVWSVGKGGLCCCWECGALAGKRVEGVCLIGGAPLLNMVLAGTIVAGTRCSRYTTAVLMV